MQRSSQRNMRVFLNPNCNYGTGRSRWATVKEEILNRTGTFQTEEIVSPEDIAHQVSEAYRNGESQFVAAGGDGTVNLLLNAIMKLGDPEITLGAIGLGSSNDFHKPFSNEALIKGMPVRIDFKKALPCDVIKIDYRDPQGQLNTRYCLINASIGLTAEANAIFNSRLWLIRMLQRVSLDAAIVAVALKTMFTYHDIPCRLTMGNEKEQKASVTNLGIIKNPHFAGSLCYDTPIKPDDGIMAINLGAGMSLRERIGMLVDLYNQRFQGRPKRRSWIKDRLTVRSDQIFALEVDGEIVRTASADFYIIQDSVRCCQ
jgi:diacylglycerol kinase (ATP)